MSQPQHDGAQLDFRAISPEEMVNAGLFFTDFGPEDQTELGQFNLSPRPFSPPPGPYGRFGKADSGEWRIYGNSSTAGRLSGIAGRLGKSASDERVTAFRPREALAQRPMSPEEAEFRVYRSLSPTAAQAAGEQAYRCLSPTNVQAGEGVLKTKVQKGGGIFKTKVQTGGGLFDLRKRTLSPTNLERPSESGKKNWLLFKSKDGEKLRKRQLSPPEVQKKQVFTRGEGKKTSGKNLLSSLGKLVKSAKVKSRGSKEGGRVISSSDGPIGSHDGGAKKERISVCKMAAMNMAKERSQDKKETVPPPSVQDWLSSSESQPPHDPAKP